MKGTDKYKEDNLFYDISVEAMCEESGHGENYDDVIKQYPGFIADYIQRLIDKINDHIDAYEYYSGRKDFSKTVKEMMSKLKGNGDVELSLDDLTLLTREQILEKYGLSEEDLERDPNTIEFASEEEKDNYFAALQYMNNDFYNLQRLYSIGNAEDVADKLVSVENRVNHLYEETPTSTTSSETSSSGSEQASTGGVSSSGSSSSGESNEVYIGSDSGSMDGITTAPKNDSSSGGSSYIPRAKTNIPETSNVESTNISEHQNEMKNATEQANNTKAFDERNEYEARKVNNEQQAQNDANKAQEAQDQADYNKKVAEQNNIQTTTTNTETTTTNTETPKVETTSVEVNETPTETVVTTTETPVQQVENVAPVSTPVVQTAASATPQVTTAVPEIKDMISNGGTTSVATKSDPSKMVSSVTSNATPLKPIKIDDTPTTETTSTAGKFIPPIAGVSTAAVAGIGAKLYMNKKDDKEKDKEEKHENKFFNENIEQEEESKLNFSSKEDIIKLSDR